MKFQLAGSAKATEAVEVQMRCPHCKHAGVFFPAYNVSDLEWTRSELVGGRTLAVPLAGGPRICPNIECRAIVFVVVRAGRLLISYPPETIDFDATALPPAILATLEEATICHSAGAYKGSALLVRRLLEELCDDRGVTGRDLKMRLEGLASTVVIPKELLEAADELRLLGNDAAHVQAKSYDGVGKAEAELAIELAKELLKAVYQYQSLVDRLRGLKKSSPS